MTQTDAQAEDRTGGREKEKGRENPSGESREAEKAGRSEGPAVQFSAVAQTCPTLCDPVDRSTPGLPVHHPLPEFTQTHVH